MFIIAIICIFILVTFTIGSIYDKLWNMSLPPWLLLIVSASVTFLLTYYKIV